MKRTLEYTVERRLTATETDQVGQLLGESRLGGKSVIGLHDVRIVEHHTTYTDVSLLTDAATAALRLVGDVWTLRTARYLEIAGQTDMFGGVVSHDHPNPLRLTVGCQACILKVQSDQWDAAYLEAEWAGDWDAIADLVGWDETWPARRN